MKLFILIYNQLNLLFYPLILIVGLFNKKIKIGIKGRKETFKKLEKWQNNIDTNNYVILVNCSSLGEYEQAKPIIEMIKIVTIIIFFVSD